MSLSTMHSVFSNNSICVVPSSKKAGFVYKFNRYKDNLYRCCQCRELGKSQYVTIVDGVVKARQSTQERRRWPSCRVSAAAGSCYCSTTSRPRNACRCTQLSKWPRDAFTSMMSSVAKKFRSSEEQAVVIALLPSYGKVRFCRQLSRQRAVRCTPVPDQTLWTFQKCCVSASVVDRSMNLTPTSMSRSWCTVVKVADCRSSAHGRNWRLSRLQRNFWGVARLRISGTTNCVLLRLNVVYHSSHFSEHRSLCKLLSL